MTYTFPLPIPTLTTARLRAPRLDDFDVWAEILGGQAGPYLGGPFCRDEAFVEFAASCGTWLLRGHGVWTVGPKAGGEVIGFILIGFEPDDVEPELGYLFRPTAEGRGYATEAAVAARDDAFAAFGLGRLVSYVDPGNAASVRLARCLGASSEGELDGSQVWVHRPVAQTVVLARSKTDGRQKQDARKTSEKGD